MIGGTNESVEAPRYSSRHFPPYRFVPGRDPHPTANPAGHSYRLPGSSEHVAHLCSPQDWNTSDEYLFGCDLYNHGYWWEAHEAWEELWQQSNKSGIQGRFLQGLIQVSACHLKWLVGHMDGARRLFESGLAYLSPAQENEHGGTYMGLDVESFIDAVRQYYGPRLASAPELMPHDAVRYPYLRLRQGSSG